MDPSPAPAAINPLLLVAACSGNHERLNILLGSSSNSRQLLHGAAAGVDDDLMPAYASFGTTTPESLLKGVTVQGDTALHAVATNGNGGNFLSSAGLIYGKAEHLLFVQNKMGDTPLHLAARAGNYEMVSHLIDLAKGTTIDGAVSYPNTATAAARVKALLETENKLKETVLHEAVRVAGTSNVKMAMLLMEADPELAWIPEHGTSPLYLAISLEKKTIAKMLYEKSGGGLSYSGPDGQNALHAAVNRGPALTRLILKWNKYLTTQTDENGRTPLHFAAEQQVVGREGESICEQLVEANPAALYQPEKQDELFPIHVAASVRGQSTVAIMFLKKCPGTAGLRDARGRTFLHAAVEKRILEVVSFACVRGEVAWILNMQDENGNTALHLAVQEKSLVMVSSLLGNLRVEINLANDKGCTPLDIALQHIPPDGLTYPRNLEVLVHGMLVTVGARRGAPSKMNTDPYYENYKDRKASKLIQETTAGLNIGSVLIATVTFGATFSLPGGYDEGKGGRPARAGRYAFDAFMIANALSFICSSIATMGFMFSGSPMVNLVTRKFYLAISVYLMHTSISSLAAAFALGVYTVLAPVAPRTAVAICVLSSLVALSSQIEIWAKRILTLRPLMARKGMVWTVGWVTRLIVMQVILLFWPIIFTFSWAAHRKMYP